MKLQRYDVFDDNYRPNDDGDWCAAEAVEELEAENETLLVRKILLLCSKWNESTCTIKKRKLGTRNSARR
jgi:hypothetical protein